VIIVKKVCCHFPEPCLRTDRFKPGCPGALPTKPFGLFGAKGSSSVGFTVPPEGLCLRILAGGCRQLFFNINNNLYIYKKSNYLSDFILYL